MLNPKQLGQYVATGGEFPSSPLTPTAASQGVMQTRTFREVPGTTPPVSLPKKTPQQRALSAVGRGAKKVGGAIKAAGDFAGTAQGQMALGTIAAGYSAPGSAAERLGTMAIERGRGMRLGEEMAKFDEKGNLKPGQQLNLQDLTQEQQQVLLGMRESGLGRQTQRDIAEGQRQTTERGQDIQQQIAEMDRISRDFNTLEELAMRGEMNKEELKFRREQLAQQKELTERELALRARELEQRNNQVRAQFEPSIANAVDKEAASLFYEKALELTTDPKYAALRQAIQATQDPLTGNVNTVALFSALKKDATIYGQLQFARNKMYELLASGEYSPARAAQEAMRQPFMTQSNTTASVPQSTTGTSGQGSARTRGAGQQAPASTATVPAFNNTTDLSAAIRAGRLNAGSRYQIKLSSGEIVTRTVTQANVDQVRGTR